MLFSYDKVRIILDLLLPAAAAAADDDDDGGGDGDVHR